MIIGLLLACAGGSKSELSLTFSDGRVLDPRLEDAAPLAIAADCDAALRIENGSGQRWSGLGSWDGRDEDGLPFDPGEARLVATCDDAVAEDTLWVVRLGVATVDLVPGADDAQIPLAFHAIDLVTPGVTELGDTPEYRRWADDGYALGDLDDNLGAPWPDVAPWENRRAPPWEDADPAAFAYSLPAAYAAGSRPALVVTPGVTAVSATRGVPVDALPEGPALRVVLDSYTAEDPGWVAGQGVALQADEALPDTLGHSVQTLTWRWQAQTEDGWQDVPGSSTTTHELWRLVGDAQLRDGGELGFAPAVTWISVLGELGDDLEGVAPEPAAVLDVIRDHLHDDPYLIYNPNDRSYSNYEGEYIYWDYIWSDLSVWLDRSSGIELYCHSVSCLLSTLAGHWGVSAPQQVLGVGFTTNYVCAAGTTSCQQWSFNSHSVVSPDDGATIWDASVNMDGDGDPGNLPVTELAPRGLSAAEYLSLLTPDAIGIVNSGLCYFQ